jgi:hypothetical protein
MNNEASDEVELYQKKMLITFGRPVAVMIAGSPVFTEVVIAEVKDKNRDFIYGGSIRVVGMPNRPDFEKAQIMHIHSISIAAMIELD